MGVSLSVGSGVKGTRLRFPVGDEPARCRKYSRTAFGAMAQKRGEYRLRDLVPSEHDSRMKDETVYRNVGDLDRNDRSALERVVGHALGESQRLVIQVMTLEVSPSSLPAG